MIERTPTELRFVRRALLSVSDKSGLIDFARALRHLEVELISTGGTAKALHDAKIPVRDVSDVTGFPEIMDGRVKTLHPRIHGGLLARRDVEEHRQACLKHGIEPIDMAVINLYPFTETIRRAGTTLEEAIEQIDIGGPAMIRSAAKNFRDVAVLVSPDTYNEVLGELQRTGGALSLQTRGRLATAAFFHTAEYDQRIYNYLAPKLATRETELRASEPIGEATTANVELNVLKPHLNLRLRKEKDLRYGENPHQTAALYATDSMRLGIAHAEVLHGKEMSFNNYIDAHAAWELVNDFGETACAIIKHTNPAGAALGSTPETAYRRALATDPLSAFGGIIAFNRPVDERAARAVVETFIEVLVAPDYTAEALEILRGKKNLRILRTAGGNLHDLDYKTISGGMLVQTPDARRLTRDDLKVVTARAPSEEETETLLFAWTVCKHTKSNAIVYAREGQTVGVGAGQMSRVDSVRIGAMRAVLEIKNSVLASDAFFPFRDGIDEAARHGITAIIQPGGSVRDDELIRAADEHKLAMVLTGIRHFKH
ncbi:MAG: bifunctional phosphoribosylaminoimidazolecarboxamide formyltransferase/IMP cyclohydrolase [Pyrinomonadaceae bacterium]|nr:bifunctional phosphoribosylaminoimidazolecarboxamide formyltransferase/IMP cyclohydrolase [Pyrinomonadaceae bacterium]